jgi:16S rRNA (cytosine967-C5)-methyltransferase
MQAESIFYFRAVKLHRSTCEAVVQNLHQIFAENRYADKVLEKTLKQNPRWGARDRRFIAETTYDIVRWKRWYEDAVGSGDFWRLLAAWCIAGKQILPPWPEWQEIDAAAVSARLGRPVDPAVRQSVPDWLHRLGEQELGSRWEAELRVLNVEADVVLRANTLKTDVRTLQELLRSEQTETRTDSRFGDALILVQRQNVFGSSAFREGLFEVQDAGSQLIAPFLDVRQGMRVVDACAGAGGKSLHLAALMQNSGRIVALDTEAWKLDELKKRARRAGAGNIETRVINSSKVIKRLENSADRLLLDVPCSGLGVLRRNPDAKWKLSADFIERVCAQQQQILSAYAGMVKPGGKLVYATCSILPSENENQVAAFLQSHAGFALEASHHQWPTAGFDGFYMARMVRKM